MKDVGLVVKNYVRNSAVWASPQSTPEPHQCCGLPFISGRRLAVNTYPRTTDSMDVALDMVEIIAFCGLNCGGCKAFEATQRNDDVLRSQVAEDWSKMFGREIKLEEINCVGCLTTSGPHINYCSICEIRKCGIERKVENCAHCVDYKCDKLVKFHENATRAKENLEKT